MILMGIGELNVAFLIDGTLICIYQDHLLSIWIAIAPSHSPELFPEDPYPIPKGKSCPRNCIHRLQSPYHVKVAAATLARLASDIEGLHKLRAITTPSLIYACTITCHSECFRCDDGRLGNDVRRKLRYEGVGYDGGCMKVVWEIIRL